MLSSAKQRLPFFVRRYYNDADPMSGGKIGAVLSTDLAGAALQALAADATLPVKLGTNRTGIRDVRGNDEARCEGVRRPACSVCGRDGVGAIQLSCELSQPACENSGRIHAGHCSRPGGA